MTTNTFQENLNKLKNYILSPNDNVSHSTIETLTINNKKLSLVLFTKVYKRDYLVEFSLKKILAVVDYNEIQSKSWTPNDKTVATLDIYSALIGETHSYVMTGRSQYASPNYHISGLSRSGVDYKEISAAFKKFNLDFEIDDKDNLFIKTVYKQYYVFNENIKQHFEVLNKSQVTFKEDGDVIDIIKDTFVISLVLNSFSDIADTSDMYPGDNTEVLACYYKWDEMPGYHPHYCTTIAKSTPAWRFNLRHLRKDDILMSNLEKFVKENFTNYTDSNEYEKPSVEYTRDYSQKMLSSFQDLIEKTLLDIKNHPKKYKKEN